jgi:GDP-L-fucose synthase
MARRVLITGARGFVGRSLAEYLSERSAEYEVIPLTRNEADLLDEAAVQAFVRRAVPDVVIHCATIGGSRKTGYDRGATDVAGNNLRMFFNLRRAMPPGVKLISMGSGAEYDLRNYRSKMKEDYFDVNVPADPYGFSKYVISKYASLSDNVFCLRIFGLFGRYEDYTYKFISNAIVKNLLGLPIVINRNVRFDYLFMDDFCSLVSRFMELAPRYQHYNITPSESIDLLTIAGLINRVSASPSEIKILNPGMGREYTGSNERLLGELKGVDFTTYERAISTLYEYYSSRLGELDIETVRRDPFLKYCAAGRPAEDGI